MSSNKLFNYFIESYCIKKDEEYLNNFCCCRKCCLEKIDYLVKKYNLDYEHINHKKFFSLENSIDKRIISEIGVSGNLLRTIISHYLTFNKFDMRDEELFNFYLKGYTVISNCLPTKIFHSIKEKLIDSVNISKKEDPIEHKDIDINFSFDSNTKIGSFLNKITKNTPSEVKIKGLLIRSNQRKWRKGNVQEYHSDRYNPCFKGFVYMSDTSVSNAAFEYLPGSSVLTEEIVNFYYEWFNYIFKLTELPDKGVPTLMYEWIHRGNKYNDKDLNEKLSTLKLPSIVKLELSENSVIFANTWGWHRRGKLEDDKERLTLNINIDCNYI